MIVGKKKSLNLLQGMSLGEAIASIKMVKFVNKTQNSRTTNVLERKGGEARMPTLGSNKAKLTNERGFKEGIFAKLAH